MVSRPPAADPPERNDGDEVDHFERLQQKWPTERPSRKRKKRQYRRQRDRAVRVRAERLPTPDTARMSRALLEARRELARAQADAEARRQRSNDTTDPAPGIGEGS